MSAADGVAGPAAEEAAPAASAERELTGLGTRAARRPATTDRTRQQLRLTVEEIRERQERELLDNREGVVGLYRTGIPEEHQPGLNVRFTGVDKAARTDCPVTAPYSPAILVPDAAEVPEHVRIRRTAD
ncbi:hypothetical protein ACWCPM_07115 [Streptomyces sp. NPDC002309]